ncbi:alpha-amylase family glycosyl hydrolase [Portibacter marinus]|uniref:alpha-amylase family glycosyl hydrolase n=1 Tax=Portibacter marinus TaxID=2898660 RepID=UPI001F1ADD2C|nr:alpha-amylase family glycosyl hydrolase [Portibacter marinus]
MRIVIWIILPFWLCAQQYTELERQQGYKLVDDQLTYIFDEVLYDVKPQQVVVTGAFRSWDQDMNKVEWQLKKKKDSSLWTLEISDIEFKKLQPQDPFKFRIDEGEWLSPPALAPNSKNGNLILMYDRKAPYMKADIVNDRIIWVTMRGVDRSFDPAAFTLRNKEGHKIEITTVLPHEQETMILHIAEPLDMKRLHFLSYKEMDEEILCTFDGWYRTLYSDKELGAEIAPDESTTTFRIFSPRATNITIYLYEDERGDHYEKHEMQNDGHGVWEHFANGNLTGKWYDFKVNIPDFNENSGHISDPYSRVQDGAWGRSMVFPKTEPASPLKNGRPAMEDVVAYEVHVIDFTDQLPVDADLKGTIPAMIQPGLKNSLGEPIGFDYLADLGINVVHLMPMQEFLNYPVDEWQASFQDDPYMQKYGIAEENYQWGYRTTHAFAVESSYRAKNTFPGAEREQFRDLVQAFHDQNMAVIIDIVPNHTGENMDGGSCYFHWNVLGKDYYYRTKDFKHIGVFGNEVKTENRPMVQRWLIDQCRHWIEEFGIDGFRIDLAGQVDRQTLIALRKALGDDIIIYGEPWIGSNDPDFEENPSWDWYKHNAPITFFQDDSRTAFKGTTSTPVDKSQDRGWPGGRYEFRGDVMKALSGGFPDDSTLLSGINYLDIHDNWALADQFALEDWDGRKGVDENRFKMAAVLLHTSLGPIVLHGGTEIMRSKGLAELEEVVKVMNNGQELAFHGKGDTYNMRWPNNFVWENVGKTKERGAAADYKGMHAYWQGLIKFRLSDTGEIFRLANHPHHSYFKWIAPRDEKALGYVIDEKVMVILNSAEYPFTFYVNGLAEGKWRLIGNNDHFDHFNGVKGKYSTLSGRDQVFDLPPEAIRVWVRE